MSHENREDFEQKLRKLGTRVDAYSLKRPLLTDIQKQQHLEKIQEEFDALDATHGSQKRLVKSLGHAGEGDYNQRMRRIRDVLATQPLPNFPFQQQLQAFFNSPQLSSFVENAASEDALSQLQALLPGIYCQRLPGGTKNIHYLLRQGEHSVVMTLRFKHEVSQASLHRVISSQSDVATLFVKPYFQKKHLSKKTDGVGAYDAISIVDYFPRGNLLSLATIADLTTDDKRQLTIYLFLQIAQMMQKLLNVGLFMRDGRLSNFLMTDDGTVKIVDASSIVSYHISKAFDFPAAKAHFLPENDEEIRFFQKLHANSHDYVREDSLANDYAQTVMAYAFGCNLAMFLLGLQEADLPERASEVKSFLENKLSSRFKEDPALRDLASLALHLLERRDPLWSTVRDASFYLQQQQAPDWQLSSIPTLAEVLPELPAPYRETMPATFPVQESVSTIALFQTAVKVFCMAFLLKVWEFITQLPNLLCAVPSGMFMSPIFSGAMMSPRP